MTGTRASGLTAAAVDFAAAHDYASMPDEARRIARRCILDGLAVALAGTEQPMAAVAERFLKRFEGAAQARAIGRADLRFPAPLAAFWNGLAGHAMDWDDTQLAALPGRPFGLLTHPTMPPLAAGLAVADMLGGCDGPTFLAAFSAGFEVECKVADAINPDHYNKGFHSSGTLGTFGAAVTAAKLLGLDRRQIARTIGVAASMAAGIRANFGTMGKPMHVGRAAENGVTAALLVADGFEANEDALDGEWGYLAVAGRGGDPDAVVGRFGNPLSIVDPGVSIKPYPCGVLTHPSMDAMAAVMRDEGLTPADVDRVTLYAADNILRPIRFRAASTALEGKFCMAFLLSAIIAAGKAGKVEFRDDFVRSAPIQEMQRRIETRHDPSIESMGVDRIRSRLEVATRDGRRIERWADENYRGGPHNPLSDREIEAKFRDCAEGLLDEARCRAVFETVWSLDTLADVTVLLGLLDRGRPQMIPSSLSAATRRSS